MSKSSLSKRGVALALAALLVAALVSLAACAQQSSQSSAADSSGMSASDSPAMVVPNVVSLTLPDAEKSIVASGLALGDVTYEASDTVPVGNVVSQSPEALSTDAPDKKVSVVVSSGKAAPKKVKVPDLKGMNQAAAEKELAKVGLKAVCDGSAETTESDPGTVFKQSIDAGTKVTEGTKVTFTIALAPSTVTVPYVVSLSEADAEAALTNAQLNYDTTSVYSDDVNEGVVVSQSYAAGTEVQVGTTVSVAISLGPKPTETVTVPYVITYSWSDAEAAMESAGLIARYTGDPSGVVIDQDYDAGEQVDEGTVVTLTLSTTEPSVEVPNLIGLSVTSAEQITDNLGLSLDGDNSGIIIDQQPAAGTYVDPDATVSVKTQPFDPVGVTVPNLVGLSAEEAYEVAEDAGLSLDGENHGTVVSQMPDAGDTVEAGSTISVKVDDSDFR